MAVAQPTSPLLSTAATNQWTVRISGRSFFEPALTEEIRGTDTVFSDLAPPTWAGEVTELSK